MPLREWCPIVGEWVDVLEQEGRGCSTCHTPSCMRNVGFGPGVELRDDDTKADDENQDG